MISGSNSPHTSNHGAKGDMDAVSPERQAELARRLDRFARTQDPSALWPGLREPERVAAAGEIERLTRKVLQNQKDISIDSGDAHHTYALSVAAHTTGMGPLLGRWLEDGLITATPELRERLAWQLHHARRRAERMERESLPAFDAMIANGVVPVMLKGFRTSREYFEEPGVRRMSDIDVLVSNDQIALAESALGAAGFRSIGTPLVPYKQDFIGPGVDERIYSLECSDERTKWVIELHASLDRTYHPGAVARIDRERARLIPCDVCGRALLALAPSVLLLELACHCSQELGSSRLLRLVEIVRVIRAERAAGRLNWDDFLAMLERTGAARYAFPALTLAEHLAPGTVDQRVLELGARESTWAARHTVARLVPAGGSIEELGLLRQIMWMRGPAAFLNRAVRLVAPASQGRPGLLPSWRVRWRQVRAGLLSFRAPDERRSDDARIL
ncbi:MAG: nucleotidyltransferase family protein [bacterium]